MLLRPGGLLWPDRRLMPGDEDDPESGIIGEDADAGGCGKGATARPVIAVTTSRDDRRIRNGRPAWSIGLPFVRIWQGALDVSRTWAGRTLTIDENVATSPSPSTPPTP